MKTFLSIIDSYDEIMDFIFPAPISFYDGFRVGAWHNSGKVGPNPRLVSIESRGNRGKPTGKIHFSYLRVRSASLADMLMRICYQSTKQWRFEYFGERKYQTLEELFSQLCTCFAWGATDSDKVSFYLLIHVNIT
jgi:hypothetical protein